MKRTLFVRELQPNMIKQRKLTHLENELKECQCCTTTCSARNLPVHCPQGCEYYVCQQCTYTYLINKLEIPHCMNCKKEWSILFTENVFTKEKFTAYRKHQQNLLLMQDKSMLPEAQVIMEERRRENELQQQIKALENTISTFVTEIRKIKRHRRAAIDNHTKHVTKTVFKCPLAACRGFINVQSQKCGLCNKIVCMECYREQTPSHQCQHTDIENVKYLKQNTKACPGCGMSTSKMEGCDQMWCTQCKKAWNWRTQQLEPENAVIHNPHYVEWQKQTRGTVDHKSNDIPCGGLPNRLPYHTQDVFPKTYNLVYEFFRLILHLRAHSTPPCQVQTMDLRIRYLSGKLSETQWAKTLMQRRECYLAKLDFYHLNSMFVLAATDILQRLVHYISTEYASGPKAIMRSNPSKRQDITSTAKQFLSEMENLRQYYNCQVMIHVNRYRTRRFEIDIIDEHFKLLNSNAVTPQIVQAIKEKINLTEME